MTTIVIFGSVILAIMFLLLSIVFNTISTIIEQLGVILFYVIGLAALVGALFLLLNAIIAVVSNWGNLFHFILSIIGWSFLLLIVLGLVITFGGWIFQIVYVAAVFVITCLHDAADGMAKASVNSFSYFVNVIKKNIGMI